MANIELIIRKIDEYLEKNNLNEIKAVEAAEYLDRIGVLKDSKDRPGLPLRNILRDNLIPNAEYRITPGNKRGFWFIHHS
ncbi:MAG: hypothetical protein J1E95_10385 [Muribaculaceae bacterium]|nr:hypothetical protein [Muribaculaceae bacterium]